MSCSWMRSEGDLDAREKGTLVGAISTVRRATVELRLRVVEHEFQIAVQVPIESDAPGLRGGRGAGRIGVARKCVIVDVEFTVTPDHFERAPAITAGDER